MQPLAEDVEVRLRGILDDDEERLIQVSSDLDDSGNYGQQWFVVTDRRVVHFPNGTRAGDVDVPISEIRRARTEGLVGGARLEVERKDGPTILVPYSQTQVEKFAEVARGVEQLRREQEFFVRHELDRTRCDRCGRLLPERNGICPACINRMNTFVRIARYLAPYKSRGILLAVASVLTTAAELIPPLVTREIVDGVFAPLEGADAALPGRVRLLGLWVLALVGVRVLTWGAEWLHGWTVTWLSARVTADIRSQLYRRMEMLSLQFYDKRKVGAVMSRVTRDTDRLQDFLVDGLPYLIVNGLMLIGILVALFTMSWRLTLYVLVPIPFIVVWGVVFWKRMRRFFTKWMQAWADLMARVNEALTGIRVVKAFGQEQRESAEFDERNRKLTRAAVGSEVNRAIFFTTTGLLTGLGVIIVWYYGGIDVIDGDLTLGTVLAFYSYLWLLYGPLEWFGMVNSWMSRAFAGAERIFEVIDAPPEAYDAPDAVPMPDMQGRIEFRDVTFGYDKSKPVLHDVNLTVKPGEMIGLVGRSGVGKTTTVNLICRFYDVDRGSILVDGVDVRDIRLEDLRRQIGIVLQEPFLFSGTVAENIGYGRPGASFDEVVEAAKAANAHDFIVTKPDGYDTQVGEKGGSLSGGEKQRVSLARAILHDPKILILDEATSSVDVQTEKKIQEAIGHLVANRTTFAIAHRLSTLRDADRLVVLDAGRIVEVGTHEELRERKGVFCKLVEMQQQISEIIAVKE
jgi:ATP-binding cassette, subfamily B, bacterial